LITLAGRVIAEGPVDLRQSCGLLHRSDRLALQQDARHGDGCAALACARRRGWL